MRICVPTATDEGLDAEVYGHFGSAPFFSVLDTDTDTVEVLANGHQHHEHGQCNPVGSLMGVKLDGVVVRGMGRNALARLGAAGIPVFVADGDTVRDIGAQVRAELLLPLDVAGACGGHAHGGPHHHHHQQG
jgi:predicted Fe-Mo cluster-binding NifX family protein